MSRLARSTVVTALAVAGCAAISFAVAIAWPRYPSLWPHFPAAYWAFWEWLVDPINQEEVGLMVFLAFWAVCFGALVIALGLTIFTIKHGRRLSGLNRVLGTLNLVISLLWAVAAEVGVSQRCDDYGTESPSVTAINIAFFITPSLVVLMGSVLARRDEYAIAALTANALLLAATAMLGSTASWPNCIPQRESEHEFLILLHVAILAIYIAYVSLVWLLLWSIRSKSRTT